MSRYVFLLAYPREFWGQASEEVREEVMAAHEAFHAFVDERGRQVASAPLADDDSATTIRHDGDQVVTSDGPFAESVEMIGGYYDVELPDFDTALAAAALLPRQYSIEVRPTIRVT